MDKLQSEHIAQVTKTLQIIVFVLAMGVLSFAAVVLFLHSGKLAAEDLGIQTLMAAGAAMISFVAAVVVPRILRRKMIQAIATGKPLGSNIPAPVVEGLGDVGRLTAAYQTTVILGVAILEGAAFYNLIAYMLEHHIISLALAAILLVGIFLKFPSRTAIENWIRDGLHEVEELRSLQG